MSGYVWYLKDVSREAVEDYWIEISIDWILFTVDSLRCFVAVFLGSRKAFSLYKLVLHNCQLFFVFVPDTVNNSGLAVLYLGHSK